MWEAKEGPTDYYKMRSIVAEADWVHFLVCLGLKHEHISSKTIQARLDVRIDTSWSLKFSFMKIE